MVLAIPDTSIRGFSAAPSAFPEPESVIKHSYHPSTGWTKTQAQVILLSHSRKEGSNRIVYPMIDLSLPPGQQECVAKVAKKTTSDGQRGYFMDVKMQMQCKQMASEFNRRYPMQPIDFLTPCVIEFARGGMASGTMGGMPLPKYCLAEPMLKGTYMKHSNNYGFASHDPVSGAIAHAFSHFTYCASQGRLLVCDMQGVSSMFTDPQIHSNCGSGVYLYGLGDIGADGIKRFFSSHQCNHVCKALGIPSSSSRSNGSSGVVPRPSIGSPAGSPNRTTPTKPSWQQAQPQSPIHHSGPSAPTFVSPHYQLSPPAMATSAPFLPTSLPMGYNPFAQAPTYCTTPLNQQTVVPTTAPTFLLAY
jgi:hypothetical protein